MPEAMLCFQTVGFPFEISEIQLTTRLVETILEFTICVICLRAGNNFTAEDEALSCVSLPRLRYCVKVKQTTTLTVVNVQRVTLGLSTLQSLITDGTSYGVALSRGTLSSERLFYYGWPGTLLQMASVRNGSLLHGWASGRPHYISWPSSSGCWYVTECRQQKLTTKSHGTERLWLRQW